MFGLLIAFAAILQALLVPAPEPAPHDGACRTVHTIYVPIPA